ncbi:hypothetical protein CMR03_20155 [Pantoea allii]|nr:hypothetical protein CMR03_20155 [Pantoea allii]
MPCLNDSPTKSGVIRSDDEAAAQSSGAVIMHAMTRRLSGSATGVSPVEGVRTGEEASEAIS